MFNISFRLKSFIIRSIIPVRDWSHVSVINLLVAVQLLQVVGPGVTWCDS